MKIYAGDDRVVEKSTLCFPPEVIFRCVLLRWTTFFIFIPSGKFVTDERCGGSTGVCGVGFVTAVFCIFFGSIVSVFLLRVELCLLPFLSRLSSVGFR